MADAHPLHRPPKGWLQNGLIPKGTICPFRIICSIAQEGGCSHKSQEHKKDFSCASARAFNTGLDYNKLRRSTDVKPAGGGGG